MILGVDLVSIRIFIFMLAGLFSSCASNALSTQVPAQIEGFSPKCHTQIENGLKNLLGISNIKISKDIFTKSSYLVLLNHKRVPFLQNDPLVGAKGSQKLFYLYREKQRCYLALLDEKKNIDSKVLLDGCFCKEVE